MANIKKFLNPNIQAGATSGIYILPDRNFPKGELEFKTVENLRLAASGHVDFFGHHKFNIEVIMGSEQPSGSDCTVILNSVRHENVSYQTEGNELKLQHKDFPVQTINLSRGDRAWSWMSIRYRNLWFHFGLWPKTKELTDDDFSFEAFGLAAAMD